MEIATGSVGFEKRFPTAGTLGDDSELLSPLLSVSAFLLRISPLFRTSDDLCNVFPPTGTRKLETVLVYAPSKTKHNNIVEFLMTFEGSTDDGRFVQC